VDCCVIINLNILYLLPFFTYLVLLIKTLIYKQFILMRIILLVIPNLNKYKSFTLMGDLKGHNLLLGMKHRNDIGNVMLLI